MSTPEGKVKNDVKRLLQANRVWHFCPVSNGLGVHGIPDFVCCIPTIVTPEMLGLTLGLFAGIETKAPGKIRNTSALQDKQIAGIRAAGGVAVVVDSAELVRKLGVLP